MMFSGDRGAASHVSFEAITVVRTHSLRSIAAGAYEPTLHTEPNRGWALEMQAMYLGGAVAVALLGAGRYSIGGLRGRFNQAR